MLSALPDDKACREYLEAKRWKGTPVCPHCGMAADNHYKLNVKGEFKGMYKCRSCKERFTVTLSTMFEGSPIPLRKWFIATYIFASHKKGISSHQLSRDLDVTQKTAWFMLHRLRLAFSEMFEEPLGGDGMIVETDTTYVGGKVKNMHKSKRKSKGKGTSTPKMDNKTIVAGFLERGGNIRFDVVEPHEKESEMVIKHIDTDSILMTDAAGCYTRVGKEFAAHEVVDHRLDEYVREKVWHTNTIEGVFSLFDRMIVGIYHWASRKHLQAYANEVAFRYNSRKISDKDRFDLALLKTNGARLSYKKLIAKQ